MILKEGTKTGVEGNQKSKWSYTRILLLQKLLSPEKYFCFGCLLEKFNMTHVIKNFALVKPKIFDENNES